MTNPSKTKKLLLIFLLPAYGIPYVMGLLLWYGSTISMTPEEMTPFPMAQMFCPAAGVMLAYLVTQWKDALVPKWFYFSFLFVTALTILCAVLSVVAPKQTVMFHGRAVSMWLLFTEYVGIGGSLLCLITLLLAGKQRRDAYGLSWKQSKSSVFCLLVFLILYFGRAALLYLLDGQPGFILEMLQDPAATIVLLIAPVRLLCTFAPFLGEEYGWRYYLQPILQKRFGPRRGVLLLGAAWGIWHIFLDFFYYATPDAGLSSNVLRIINCVTLGIFFAWAYSKTNNIWVPVILHYLNNNLSFVYANTSTTMPHILWTPLLNSILFGLFLLSKEFRGIDDEQ